jgi:hypothetical protein
MLRAFRKKAQDVPEMACTVCASPVNGTYLCEQCVKEDGVIDYRCVICKDPCSKVLVERIRLPCGDMVHARCASTIDLIGRCPGSCVYKNKNPTQCPSLQAWLLDYILYAHGIGPRLPPKGAWDTNDGRLTQEDLKDLEDEHMFWVLRCIFANGIGVELNDVAEAKWLEKAVEQDDPEALFFMGVVSRDLAWVYRAAKVGHAKAILTLANYFRGNQVLGQRRPANQVEAARYIAMGVDPVCRSLQALDVCHRIAIAERERASPAVLERLRNEAEFKLRLALRENYSTDDYHGKVVRELASLYYDRNDIVRAFTLTAMTLKPTADVYIAAGIALSAMGNYKGDPIADSVKCFREADNASAYVYMAQLMLAKVMPGGPTELFALVKGAMDRDSKDEDFIVRVAVHFVRAGRPEFAAECKRMRAAMKA